MSVTWPAFVCSFRSYEPARVSARSGDHSYRSRAAELVRLGLQEAVERLLDAPPDHFVDVTADLLLVDLHNTSASSLLKYAGFYAASNCET